MCGLLAFQNGMALDIHSTMWNVTVVVLKYGIFLNPLKIGWSKKCENFNLPKNTLFFEKNQKYFLGHLNMCQRSSQESFSQKKNFSCEQSVNICEEPHLKRVDRARSKYYSSPHGR